MYWYLKVVRNYLGFTGRARRKELWMFILFNAIICLILTTIGEMTGLYQLALIYSFAVLLPNIAVSIRRLHDTGLSGWFTLFAFIPVIGLYLIFLLCQDSEPGENAYGPNPKGVEA